MRSEVVSAVSYPAFVLGFGVFTVVILLTVVLPRLFNMLQEMLPILPLPTLILLKVSGVLHHHWPWMAVAEAPAVWRSALGFAQTHLSVDNGFDFNGDGDGVWVEGTAQAALAYRFSGNATQRDRLLAGLKGDRTQSGLLNASRTARLTTGLSIDPAGSTTVPDFFYYRRPHLGATA